MSHNQGEHNNFFLENKDENELYVAPHLVNNSMDSTVEDVTKSVDFKMEQLKNELNQSKNCIISMREQLPQKPTNQDPKMVKILLKEKYEEALKRDEKLEAEAERSVNDPNSDMEEHQAELKKRHKNEIEVYQVVQEKIMASFKKDMDNLMLKFDEEFSRLRKVHLQLLADKQKKKKDSAVVTSTHQP
uniref:Uncharacterized protein LOC108048069 isoform X1 n=1 Tax=Drosophila rhopaloa TaxID=1041015 RepID=A0A6P4F4R7_DRORH